MGSSGETNIRRLAASAMGKVAVTVSDETKNVAREMKKAHEVLNKLSKDPAPQVRQYADKSLSKFSPNPES